LYFDLKLTVDEKSSILIENNGELLLGKKAINRYHLVAFYLILELQKITYVQDKYEYI
tara:strand:+ start:57 stop:230 length:174 start_codon:yes stop_codon:yes gene_type:complete